MRETKNIQDCGPRSMASPHYICKLKKMI